MHTLHKYEDDNDGMRWSVGFWQPAAYNEPVQWLPLLDFINMSDAAAWVSYLNGGSKPDGTRS